MRNIVSGVGIVSCGIEREVRTEVRERRSAGTGVVVKKRVRFGLARCVGAMESLDCQGRKRLGISGCGGREEVRQNERESAYVELERRAEGSIGVETTL
jgi:hypothetical protein